MLLPKRWSMVMLAAVSLLFVHCDFEKQAKTEGQLEPFYGTFSGVGTKRRTGEVAKRDLTVTIKPLEGKGFTVDWHTAIYRDGEKKKTQMSIDFLPSSRSGIYASAMRKNVFGDVVPYDPANTEDPYVWAGLNGDMLTVTALYIMDGGNYEMQVYKRTLNTAGLALEFERLKDGERVVEVSSILERVEP